MCNAIHNVNDLPRVIVEVRGGRRPTRPSTW